MNVRATIESLAPDQEIVWSMANLKIDDLAVMDHVVREVEKLEIEGLVMIKSVNKESMTGNSFKTLVIFEKRK